MAGELDEIIHSQARLRIVAALAALNADDEVSFPKLQKLLDVTAGNLSTHLRKLEDAGYVRQVKTFVGRKPTTYLSLTAVGRSAFDTYTQTLRALLEGSDDAST